MTHADPADPLRPPVGQGRGVAREAGRHVDALDATPHLGRQRHGFGRAAAGPADHHIERPSSLGRIS